MSYLNRKIKSIIISGLLSMGIIAGNYIAFNKEVVLIVNGQEIEVNSRQSDVQGVLEENKINYDVNDIISQDLDASLEDGMKIEVNKVTKKTVKETEEISYDTIVKNDSSLLKGKTKVSQKGKNGTKELTYIEVYKDGKLESKELIGEEIIEKPQDKIIKKGTKKQTTKNQTTKSVSATSTSSKSSKSSLGTRMTVQATAYSGDTITSTGTVPKWGTIAVDPSVIPYGTRVYIPQFDKYFIAEDCGGAIKGNKIDIFMNSESSCDSWGRRTIDIYVVK